MARAGPILALFTFYAEIARRARRRTVTFLFLFEHLLSNSFYLKIIVLFYNNCNCSVLQYNIHVYAILDNKIIRLLYLEVDEKIDLIKFICKEKTRMYYLC